MSGAFYRQFALTITASTVISATVSLTLSPALAALLLKPHGGAPQTGLWAVLARPFNAFFAGFNFLFERLSLGYGGLTRRVLRISMLMLVIYGGLIGLTYFQFPPTPSGLFLPLHHAQFILSDSVSPRSALACRRG